jgi:nicotinate-nucleotide adenylyltransferase
LPFFHAGPAPKIAGPRRGALRDGLDLRPGMSVGLFGGSFNPAHDGHAHVAETALRRLGLDRVVWLVSPQNPLKDARESAALSERMASAKQAARLAASGPSMIVSDVETRLGTQWTVDTLRGLVARHPGVHFVWLMGSDNLASFHQMARLDRHHAADADGGDRPPGLAAGQPDGAPAAARFADARVPAQKARLLSSTWRPRPGPI